MTIRGVMESSGALTALPLVVLAAVALLAITIRSEAGPGPLAAATPVPDAALKQECIEGAAVGWGNDGLAADCALLLAAKDTLRGTETLNWSVDTAIASWEGITVAGSPLRVTEVVLDRNTSGPLYGRRITLGGTIPAELGGLSKLERLVFSRNELTGTIPVELANLSELTQLSLYNNELTGGIPPELGNLSNLTTLNLRRNPLGGSIPVELGRLTNLRALYLEGSQLTGSIPASLGDLPNLAILKLYGNTLLTGCIPASLRGITNSDLGSLDLDHCTTTTTHALTTSVVGNGRISPLPGTYSYLSGDSVTVTATPEGGWRIASWGDDCAASGGATTCTLTMSAARTASVTFERIPHALTVTATGGGSVTPGTSTQYEGDEVTLTASWNDATHDFGGWGGDCAGTGTTCVLTIDAAKTVTATFTALPADRCAEPEDADCVRAVYLGAPGDYAQVPDIPADALLTPASDGRYYVGRGQQVTVVTAAPLPAGWTRFWLDRTPLEFGEPSPTSFAQLIQPVGTTYTFTVTDDERGASVITFDLKAARPHPVRPTHKPVLGDVVVTTEFLVPTLRYNLLDTTGAATAPGSYALLQTAGDALSAIGNFGLRPARGVELRIHPTDASGVSRAALYDTLKVGDAFEYHTYGLDCAFRFRVTSVPATASVPRSYGIDFVTGHGGRCGDGVDDPAAAKNVDFAWLVAPGLLGEDGIREFIPGEPAGNGTYRIASGARYVVDVPLGMRIVASPEYLRNSSYRTFITSAVTLRDEETGARLQIDPGTGEVFARDVSTRLDPIVDSIRLAD